MGDEKTVECWVRTRASIPYRSETNERYPADVDTHATARGNTPVDRQIASDMAGQIGSGQSVGAFRYLETLRKLGLGDE